MIRLFILAAAVALAAQPKRPAGDDLARRVAGLELKVAQLERQCAAGIPGADTISVYYVDSAAGKIVCRSCRFVEETQ
jgi:hypothetical protein